MPAEATVSTQHASTPRYTVTELPPLPGGTFCRATAINDKGQIVGYGNVPRIGGLAEDTRAVLWENGKVVDLLGKPDQWVAATAINNTGQVLIGMMIIGNGTYTGSIPPPPPFVISWDNGTQTLWNWKSKNEFIPTAINNRGVLVGTCRPGPQLALWKNGKITQLPPSALRPGQIANAINDSGEIVGGWHTTHGFFYQNGRSFDVVAHGFDLDHGLSALNSQGEAVGVGQNDQHVYHLFRWKQGKLEDLGRLSKSLPPRRPGQPDLSSGCDVVGMNDRGEILGNADDQPFVWLNGKRTDLNKAIPADSGWELLTVHGINSRGQIVGEGEFKGENRGFLLTPQSIPGRIPSAM